MKYATLLLCLATFFLGCQQTNTEVSTVPVPAAETPAQAIDRDITGQYVTADYHKRQQGYDWVAVIVKRVDSNHLSLAVRSRADKKKPTCTFDATAQKITAVSYQGLSDGKPIFFNFSDSTLNISVERPEDEVVLHFYCSGGASLAGSYVKISEPLDTTQIDHTLFSKVLMLQDIGFNISTKPSAGGQALTIQPFGLSIDNKPYTALIKGEITDVEIEDLDVDGSPELLVYTSEGNDQYGNVIATSVNNKKSMSLVSFMRASENPKIREGYAGYDRFSLVENTLSQRFPVVENGKKTGKVRQVDYVLKKGEASKRFDIKNITEY